MATFSADSDDVSVWENVGLLLVDFHVRFELSVVTQIIAVRLFKDSKREKKTREDSQRETKERKWGREREKTARNFGPPSGSHPS